jgi:excinuclease ABC subunit A
MGSEGGMIVAEGAPEDVVTIPEIYTGKFLREVLV